MSDVKHATTRVVVLRIYAALLVLVGGALALGGGRLLALGGSPFYLLFGIAVAAAAILLWLRRAEGAALYGVMLLVTLIWSLWEAGFDGWALMPRLLAPTLLGVVLILPWVRRVLVRRVAPWKPWVPVVLTGAAVLLGAGLHAVVPPLTPADPLYQTGTAAARAPAPAHGPAASGDWPYYGGDAGGSRFSALDQITPANVAQLQPAWTFQLSKASARMRITPLKIGDRLYACSSVNEITALNAETGKPIWRFDPKVDASKVPTLHCRGVAYYKAPSATGVCAERIITGTVDARLIAIDARDGKPCPDFGVNGEISLLAGMGEVMDGYYYVTSAPTLVRGKVVVGGWVNDNEYWGEPSGVVRAFDALTGKLAWAWDVGRPDRQTEPPAGEHYTPATPNSWGPMSADEARGLVYVPTGNATPDYFGAYRRPFDDRYASSVVAIDAATGKPRWSFQTTHHDLWDYDVPAQPTLVDYRTANGTVPALIQVTKSGEVFVLDRSTGKPLRRVEERPVPQAGKVREERLSPTQPFSVEMPSFRSADLVENDMWGITPLDQLWCRIKFREARYEGIYTPPGLGGAIQSPGAAGGLQWGSVSVDPTRKIVIANSINMPFYIRLLPRAEADKMGLKRWRAPGPRGSFRVAQEGTPYGIIKEPFMSPLKVPCNQPPFGRISAFDLVSGKLIWTRMLGSARDLGPLGTRSMLPFPVGTPNFGGSVITRSGLVFIGAAEDRYLRAYEAATGNLLWKASMPGAGNATPMTYVSNASGRQFVVISTAAAGLSASGPSANQGAFLVAYALPK